MTTKKAAPKAAAPTATKKPAAVAPAVAAPAAVAPDLAAVGGKAPKAPKAPKPPKAEAPTCTGTRKDGSACTAKCKGDGQGGYQETCVDHQPVLARLTESQQAAWDEWVGQQDAGSIADLLGWHKVRDLIGEPVNTNPNHNESKVV